MDHRGFRTDDTRAAYEPATSVSAPGLGTSPAALPGDPLFPGQWHLRNTGQTGGTPGVDINVADVWRDYTGRGVTVGVVDDGVQHGHADLDGNYDTALDYDAAQQDGDARPAILSGGTQAHGTAVAGLIAAENNGVGGVGVAYDATLTGFRMAFDGSGPARQEVDLLARQHTVDVSNNSWSFTSPFADNFLNSYFFAHDAALDTGVSSGRDGLGTVFLFAAGNARAAGDNVNAHNLQNARETIAVAAIDHTGDVAWYSTPGAAILVGAPSSGSGVGVTTTDISGAGNGYATGSDFTSGFGGTSAATPITAGVVALMLEANPGLGYRDVQEILAFSARHTAGTIGSAAENGAGTWNGGGLLASHDVGFGLVDARAAVRLAETWRVESTRANEVSLSGFSAPGAAIPDPGTVFDTITLSSDIVIDHVEVELHIDHAYIGDLVVRLISPDGTESVLVDRPGKDPDDPRDFGLASNDIDFTLTSTHFWGETGNGTWTIAVTDAEAAFRGTLDSWTLTLYGDTATADDTYIFTDQFATFTGSAHADRRTLADDGGTDTINLAALTGSAVLDLTPGVQGAIAGNALAVAQGTVIEHVIGGDGDDTLRGNAADNRIEGSAGDDWIVAGAGDDTLFGGAGIDTLRGRTGADRYIVQAGDGITRIDEHGGDVSESTIDTLVLTDVATLDQIEYDVVNRYLRLGLPDGEAVWSVLHFAHSSRRFEALELATGDTHMLPHGPVGGGTDDIVFGENGDDVLAGSAGDDLLFGWSGDDWITGGAGDDTLSGGSGIDTLRGKTGADRYIVNAGDGTTRIDEQGGDASDQIADTLFLADVGAIEEIGFHIVGDDFRLQLAEGEAVVSVGHLADPSHRFEILELANGDTHLLPRGPVGGGGHDILFGEDAADTMAGSAGDDLLFGRAGDDWITGGTGNDTLSGGAGIDTLRGRTGADRYLVHAGDGITRLDEHGGNGVEHVVDTLVLADVDAIEQIDFGRVNNYLRLGLPDGEAVWGVLFFGDESRRFEALELGGGASYRVPHGTEGTSAADILFGATGGDTLIGSGGHDVLVADAGDDVLAVSDTGFASLDGGGGSDVVRLDGSGLTLDFTAVDSAARVRDIEAIDLGSAANTLVLDAEGIGEMTSANALIVHGGASDTVATADAWTPSGSELIDGRGYTAYSSGDSRLVIDDQIERGGGLGG